MRIEPAHMRRPVSKTGITVIFLFFTVLLSLIFFLKPVKKAQQPNIVLITIDALRPDHLGCYGYKLNTSPNIDKFAKEATLFTQDIAQGTVTAVSFSSFLTSTYPRTHGVYRMGHRLNNKVTTLARILKNNNYITAAIVCWDIRNLIPGLSRGFDFVSAAEFDAKADEITKMAISYLEENQGNKFFLWLHYFDTHIPFNPPAPYNRLFINNFKSGARFMRFDYNRFYPGDMKSLMPKSNTVDIDYFLSQYDGAIGFIDEQIGILLRKVREMNLDDKTIIIITADHGEVLDEHKDFYFCHDNFYDEVLKVPLLIKYKNIIPASKIINQPVQSIDIAPTILALSHIPESRAMQGRSLLPLIYGKRQDLRTYTFAETLSKSDNNSTDKIVRGEGWKLVYKKTNSEEKYELYNLSLDESADLADKQRERLEFLKKKLDSWYRQVPFNEPEEGDAISEREKRVLRSLGYLQ